MKSLNVLTKLILMIGLSLTMIACDKKKDSQPNFANRYGRNGVGQNGIYPGGNPNYPNGQTLGYIYNNAISDFTNQLYDFLALPPEAYGELEYTSAQLGQNTGVLFDGDVSVNGQSGQIQIYVYDQYAARTGEAYVVRLNVVEGRVDQNGARIVASDNTGYVVFQGNWSNGQWVGNVQYDNNDGRGLRSLGQFVTGECYPIRCQ